MQCGISTACFFPRDTLESFEYLAKNGVPVTELFLNTFSELDQSYVDRLLEIQARYGIRVSSVHPFSGIMEGFLFASAYETRLGDGIALYRRFYEICRLFGADKLVFHGDHEYNLRQFSDEAYAENFAALARAGLEYGVTLCQENVAYCRCSDTQAVHSLRPLFGEYSAFVLDTKQACRRGVGIYALMAEMGEDIRQVHASDHAGAEHCLPPGAGEMDFVPFIAKLREYHYDGDLIIELYSDNYSEPQALLQAMHHLQGLADRG